MKFLKSFLKKEKAIQSNADFWGWFEKHSDTFYQVIKNQGDVHKVFFKSLSSKLGELKEGYWYLAGMYDEIQQN